MTHEIDYTEFIERYLLDEMSSKEKAWFQKEIEGNPALQEEIDFHRKIDAVLSDRSSVELKAQLETIHDDIYETAQNGKGMIKKLYRRAYISVGTVASAVLLIFFLLGNNYSSETIMDLYYQPVESSVSFRDAGGNSDMLFEAMTFYENQEYEKAIALFEDILANDESKIGVNLYAGVSHMELKNYKQAHDRFQKIIDQNPNPFVESATWYLGLCYLLTNEREKAQESFSAIAKGDGYYKADAKKILKRL
jgi:tetratricopeptide (TPR) repeat protein